MPVAHRRGSELDVLTLRILAELDSSVPLHVDRLLECRKLVCIDRTFPDGRVQGIVDLGTGVVAVDPRLPRPKRRVVICHEVAHAVLPGHQLALLHRCSEFDLRWERHLLEGETNQFGATLLFGGVPDATIAESEVSLAAVARLAAMTDTPVELAFRRFVLRNPGRAWGLVCEPPASGDPDEDPSPPLLAVRHMDASQPSIWCGRPRAVALPPAAVSTSPRTAARPAWSGSGKPGRRPSSGWPPTVWCWCWCTDRTPRAHARVTRDARLQPRTVRGPPSPPGIMAPGRVSQSYEVGRSG